VTKYLIKMGTTRTVPTPGYLPERPNQMDRIPAQPRPPLQIPAQPRRIDQFPVQSRQIDQIDQFPVQPHQTKQSQQNFYNIKCPLCRKDNSISKSQNKIVGCDIECSVCFEKADMFLPQCGHINICLDCIKKMDAS